MTSSGRALDSTWSRRQFLQRTGMGGAALLSAGTMLQLLEACAGPGTTPSTGNVKASWTNVVIPENLDPHIGFDTDTLQFTHNVYEALLEYTPGGLEVRPLLAESMPSVSSDGLTYTFKIRQGVTFHSGATLTALVIRFVDQDLPRQTALMEETVSLLRPAGAELGPSRKTP